MDLENSMFGDLHIHSRFSRACSKDLTIPNLVKWARIKGLDLLGTGDFTHPVWFEEIKKNLKDNGKGFFYYEDEKGKFPFLITGEISLMYTQGKGRRVHLVVLIPSIEVAEKVHLYLDGHGRRDYDGRPIFKISCEDFVRDLRKISHAIEIIPAHIWTPWFGIFGSKSGFDSLKEAFGDQLDFVHAIETGISSDPPMNWKIKEIENKSIVSFSDSHSFWPWRLGREATIFRKTDSYFEVVEQIRKNTFIGTIETDPAYGMYHFDGHRNCNFSCSYEETQKLKGICPKCGNALTIGVEYRVEELASGDSKPNSEKNFYKILPLHEIISLAYGIGLNSKKVWEIYNKFISDFENEFRVLLNADKNKMLEKGFDKKLVDLIILNREGRIKVKPGYDGVYGEALIEKVEKQKTLF
jgi:uncharacterized protein (TIGR00375 family)